MLSEYWWDETTSGPRTPARTEVYKMKKRGVRTALPEVSHKRDGSRENEWGDQNSQRQYS